MVRNSKIDLGDLALTKPPSWLTLKLNLKASGAASMIVLRGILATRPP